MKEKNASRGSETFAVSGRLDSNQRPLAPHTSALPGCATSRNHDLKTLYKKGLQIGLRK